MLNTCSVDAVEELRILVILILVSQHLRLIRPKNPKNVLNYLPGSSQIRVQVLAVPAILPTGAGVQHEVAV